jgi:hypothetical protein
VIWLAIGDRVKKLDLMEMFVHELTHHLLFIDELNQPQVDYELIKCRENFALSAILKRRRPLIKVIHSIVVCASLIDARYRFLHSHAKTIIHPDTHELKADTMAAIRSLRQLPNISDLVTAHTIDLLAECVEFCREPVLVD